MSTTNNDGELLELAAKAAGIELEWRYNWRGNDLHEPWHDGSVWEPLSDDGDALRLAVKLGIGLLPEATGVREGTAICHERFGWHIFTGLPDEPQAAARHAIVRAAAAIGSAM